jgi:hypothetical protein
MSIKKMVFNKNKQQNLLNFLIDSYILTTVDKK